MVKCPPSASLHRNKRDLLEFQTVMRVLTGWDVGDAAIFQPRLVALLNCSDGVATHNALLAFQGSMIMDAYDTYNSGDVATVGGQES
jgi:hypothetical protein